MQQRTSQHQQANCMFKNIPATSIKPNKYLMSVAKELSHYINVRGMGAILLCNTTLLFKIKNEDNHIFLKLLGYSTFILS